ncbi:MAG: SDR family oxidoreductase [Hyphomicrobiales bacterium]|nr:SDR family oxidoreductase [Hyphomicrobiales bacterium]
MAQQQLFDLVGRTALVTGASRGIGRALAAGLAAAGADIVAVSRSLEALAAVRRDIEAIGQRCYPQTADVSSIQSIAALFAELANQGIVADILVNNAGVEEVRNSTDVDAALWDKIVGTNLRGAFFVARDFARPLIATDRAGSIINLGSLSSAVGIPTATPYTSSKGGILGMTRALASEWAPKGVRVNAVGPGYFRTEMTEPFYRDDDWQQAMLAKIPMRRFGRLDDLIGVTVFLASDASAYLTGQIIYVDGGTLASI